MADTESNARSQVASGKEPHKKKLLDEEPLEEEPPEDTM
jgi:hypothetical protein